MKRLIIGFMILAATCSISASAQKRLTIMHVNDTHSHLEPLRSGENPAGMGGIIERAAYRDSVMKADGRKNVLFLHAGDFSQGTSYFSVLHGDIEIDLMNAMRYDCVTLGNHEFDNGTGELARRLGNLKCPVVCANYDFSQTELGPYVKPYTIIRKAGLRIGIIGMAPDLTTLVSKDIAAKMTKLDNAEVVNSLAALLKDEKKCDMVVVLSHLGFTGKDYIDPQLVRRTRGVDIVIGGHSHTYMSKPYYEKNLDGKEVPIVQDGCWGLNVGNMKVTR